MKGQPKQYAEFVLRSDALAFYHRKYKDSDCESIIFER